MSQQTINVGAAPNDGTGTPLRTAFQYTNSNFTELYTAVGPSGNNIVVPGNATITGDLTVDTSTLIGWVLGRRRQTISCLFAQLRLPPLMSEVVLVAQVRFRFLEMALHLEQLVLI
jgi:hypothetical protein